MDRMAMGPEICPCVAIESQQNQSFLRANNNLRYQRLFEHNEKNRRQAINKIQCKRKLLEQEKTKLTEFIM
jgi:hypothetical protein